MMEAVRTSETSVDNHFTRQYNPEDSSEHHTRRRENLKTPSEFPQEARKIRSSLPGRKHNEEMRQTARPINTIPNMPKVAAEWYSAGRRFKSLPGDRLF
jgi:hypothetical protein